MKKNDVIIKKIKYIITNSINGEFVINLLKKINILNLYYYIKKKDDIIYIPINNYDVSFFEDLLIKIILLYSNIKKKIFIKIKNCINILYLKKNKKKIDLIDIIGYNPTYEIIGDIIILYKKKEYIDYYNIGHLLLNYFKNINTVLLSLTPIKGEFRTRTFYFICGIYKKKTYYKENNCIFFIDLEKVYFTQHLANERKNLLDKIQDGSIVIDMFSGFGPFSILISKIKSSVKVISIDKNPNAIKLLK